MTDNQWPSSLWAAVTPAWPASAPLEDDIEADAVVIGAGFTGLSTALHLAQSRLRVVVIEAVEPGWGASGRNNGQVIPTLTRPNPDDIIRRHGEAGERFVAMLRDSADNLFRLIREENIAAEAEQTGWVQPVHTPGRMKIADTRVEQWSRHGAPVELLSSQQIHDITGSDIWHGGFWNKTGGHINPLALARGLADRVVVNGGQIYCHTVAQRIEHKDNAWQVSTQGGRVTAPCLMLATHAYTGEHSQTLAARIAHEVVPAVSWQLATRPLSDTQRQQVIPGRQAVSDTHGDLHFMRYDARNRLVTGGALVIRANGAARLKRRIGKRLARVFKSAGEFEIEYVWNGFLGMTTDYMPRIHQLGPNGYAWVGCNGRGVALSAALGQQFAKAMTGTPLNELALPLTVPVPLPAHGLIRRIAPLRLLQYRWADRREV
ncbi:MAG: FAD-dependent oxidoreductase [Burkholderiaceae bacterium]